MQEVLKDLARFVPELFLTGVLLLVVIVDAIGGRWRDASCRWLAIAGLAVALVLCGRIPEVGSGATLFNGMLALDPLGVFFKTILVLASLLVALVFSSRNSRELRGLGQGEFFSLLLAVTVSNMLLAASNDLAMLYLSLEMVSITSYVMVAYMKGDRMSNEASLKYVLFGAVSTGAMLYGFSLLYGLVGNTGFAAIQAYVTSGLSDAARLPVYLTTFLILAGFGFKTALVPFHFWCPDVYQGAPTPVTAFLSVAPKAAGFAVMVRFFFTGFATSVTGPWDLASGSVDWPRLLIALSVLSMTVGNVAALTQTNMKRMLAYSSIAHAGYILMGLVALSENGARSILIYLTAYLVMNLGAFLVVTLIHNAEGSFDVRDYPGLYRRAPGLTLAMAIFLLSLTGIPPLVGFMGKLYVFQAIIEKGPELWWFAFVGAINAAIGAYYYFRVLRMMVIDPGNEEKPVLKLATADAAWVFVLAAANLLPLLFWSRIEAWAKASLVLYAGG